MFHAIDADTYLQSMRTFCSDFKFKKLVQDYLFKLNHWSFDFIYLVYN